MEKHLQNRKKLKTEELQYVGAAVCFQISAV